MVSGQMMRSRVGEPSDVNGSAKMRLRMGLAELPGVEYNLFLKWRRTQVAKGEVCKTFMLRFESARRLQISSLAPSIYKLPHISTFIELGNIWEQ
jgi:hypothetical protein